MRKLLLTLSAVCAVTLLANGAKTMNKTSQNPFLAPYTTKYEIPPFQKIHYADYIPALKEGIAAHKAEIDAIVNNPAAPTFDNTILALDCSGKQLNKVAIIIYALSESDNTPEMNAITKEAFPMLSSDADAISMNEGLFKRIKAVYDNQSGLNTAQKRLVDKFYKSFVRNGALLNPAQKETLKSINLKLSDLELSFSNNVLDDTNNWKLVVDNKDELAGLPQSAIDNAAAEAKSAGMEGKWVFTLHAPSRLAVLTYADNRGLRERMYEGYMNLASKGDKYDNSKNINDILTLRTQKAQLLGFDSFADYQLDNVMAKTVKNAENLLYQIWNPAIAKVKEEVADMQKYADAHGGNFKIAPWDYYYYADKVKKEKFDVNDDVLRPYFKLENVRAGIFYMANKLYGITFTEMPNAPKYNPEVTVYDVKDAQGKHIAVYMTDYYPRPTKVQGAWMSEMKPASNINGKEERPIIFNVANLTKPTKEMPSLLTIDEVQTMFHEFGHALQGMLTKATYYGQEGTNVDRDFVEFPSQMDEHWATEPELLKIYAKHYKTGEVIPDSLIQKIQESMTFNQGFITTELVGAALLDLEWHKVNYCKDINVKAFEKSVANRLDLPKEIQFRYRSPYFKHIFGSDQYASGYYTYLWAQVLDCDGFELFKEKGIFNHDVAKAYLENVLEQGDGQDPMVLYKNFRGHAPSTDALLKMRGLK
jgi:peptidyl-dipeptidase Dcp